MDPNNEMLMTTQSSVQKYHINDKKGTYHFNPSATSSRIAENGSLSSRLGFTSKPLTLSTHLINAPASLKNTTNSPVANSAEFSKFRQRGDLALNLSPTITGSPSHFTSGFNPNVIDMRKQINTEAVITSPREHIEYMHEARKNSVPTLIDFSQSARLGERNRSLENVNPQLDVFALPSMRLGSPSNGQVSQAYTMAMKALQDRIRSLEEKEKENQLGIERQEEAYRIEVESLILRHQAEMTRLAESEIESKERAEKYERQNMEFSSRLRNLEEENSYLRREINDNRLERSEIEGKYGRIISEKMQDYEEIEHGVERLRKELDTALKNESILKERLHQAIVESTKEKEALRVKNSTLTEALQRIEKETNDTTKVHCEQQSELMKKNKVLEQEIEQMKKNYSQQMTDFDKELGEIEKGHTEKIKEQEKTITELKQKIADLEKLSNTQKENLAKASKLATINTSRSEIAGLLDIAQSPSILNTENIQITKPKRSLKIRSEFLNNFSEDNMAEDNNLANINTSRTVGSPFRTNRSTHGVGHEKNFSAQVSSYNRIKTETDVNVQQKSPPQSPANRTIDQDLGQYLSTQQSLKKPPTSGDKGSTKPKVSLKGIPDIVPLKGLQAIQELGQKSLSFINSEPDRKAGASKSSARGPILKESSYATTRNNKREDLGNTSEMLSPRNLSRRESRVLDEQLAVKEKELKELNEEYQKIIQKTQESEDSKERSRMRVYLIEITEEIQQINEEIYQLKKQGAVQRQ